MFGAVTRLFGISGSGLSAQRARLDAIAANIANKDTTRTPEGGPYKPQQVVFEQEITASGKPGGVLVSQVIERDATVRVHDPEHPDADEDGYVLLPDVDPVAEMTDLIGAQRSYQMNAEVVRTSKGILFRALEILGR